MEKSIKINNTEELKLIKVQIEKNMLTGKQRLQNMMETNDTFSFYSELKFRKTVPDPITGEPENFLEVINQYHTYLVSLYAVEKLLKIHNGHSFIVHLGNVSGYDIVSEDESIIAECFAATSYRSNRKLIKDLEHLSNNKTATYKYEFFYDLEFSDKNKRYYEEKYPDIVIQKVIW